MKKIFIILLILNLFTTINGANRALQIAKNALYFTNQYRLKNGLKRLQWNPKIAQIARQHATRMGNKKAPFSHQGFHNRVMQYPKLSTLSGENLFLGNKPFPARTAVNSWIKSPGHRQNLLGNFNTIGIGAFKNKKGIWYITQLFANF